MDILAKNKGVDQNSPPPINAYFERILSYFSSWNGQWICLALNNTQSTIGKGLFFKCSILGNLLKMVTETNKLYIIFSDDSISFGKRMGFYSKSQGKYL